MAKDEQGRDGVPRRRASTARPPSAPTPPARSPNAPTPPARSSGSPTRAGQPPAPTRTGQPPAPSAPLPPDLSDDPPRHPRPDPAQFRRERERPAAARLFGAGARVTDTLAQATGVSAAIDEAVEEAIVRAFRSQALRRALERALNDKDPHEDIDPEELADLVRRFLSSEAATAVWGEILESQQAQMLVERIADAPEVRAAITAQGAGMIGDLGVRITRLTEALDDAIERIVRPRSHDSETDQAGLATRSLAAAIDIGLLVLLYLFTSAIASSIKNSISAGAWPVWLAVGLTAFAVLVGISIITAFWALIGQTLGMRFLAIRVVHQGDHELGFRRAIRRMICLLLGLLPAGLGWWWIARDDRRRAWHDRLAGTEVVYLDVKAAPWSGRQGNSAHDRAD